MTPATRKFQLAVIRLLKGILRAWEDWVKSHPE